MKLVNCPICGTRCSADTEKCPECGFINKNHPSENMDKIPSIFSEGRFDILIGIVSFVVGPKDLASNVNRSHGRIQRRL